MEKLACRSLRTPQLQVHQYLLPPPEKEVKRKREFNEQNCRKIRKTKCFCCKRSLVSVPVEKPSNLNGFLLNPVGDVSDSFSDQRMFDPRVLCSVLQSCSSMDEVRRIHAISVKLYGGAVTFVDNNLISVYINFANLIDARKVFDKMCHRNVVSWTAILNGYLKMGLDDEVVKLIGKMVENSVQANSLTFVCLLNYCRKRLDFQLGRQVHSIIAKRNRNNMILDSALVCFYAQCGDLSDAFRIFNRMPEWDVICWTTMITACAQHGNGDKALSMFSQMQYYGFMPNEFTVCSVLKACGEENALKFGRQLHAGIIKHIFNVDVFVGSSLLCMYVKCGEVTEARKVFDFMPKRNTVTWTAMIAGYAQNGMGEEAISLFRSMRVLRIFANSLTVVSILSACGSISSLSLGKEVHGQILKTCIQGNLHIASTLIWTYCKCAKYAYAAKILEAMPLRDVISWTAIISGFTSHGHVSEALQFLNEMLWEGVEPNPFTYSSALKACANLIALREGKWIHAYANKTRALSNVFVSSALINLYMRCGCVTDADRVFNIMPERNLVSWKVMIIGYARNGLCRKALKLMYRMQAEGFVVDDFIHTTVLCACGDVELDLESKSMTCLESN